MRYAIEITQDLKDANPIFKDNEIGSIRRFGKLPQTFVINGLNTHNIKSLPIEDLNAIGFYELITPSINASLQYLGDIYFDVDKFTYEILDYTAEEIEARQSQINDVI